MNDRCLFKAKRIDNEELVQGYYVNCLHPTSDIGTGHFIVVYPGDYYIIYTSTLCQCTGLKDKNGNLIWENDVVKCVFDGTSNIRIVVWDESELDFKGTNGKEFYRTDFNYLGCCEEIEVIGNIFDNPELLEVE